MLKHLVLLCAALSVGSHPTHYKVDQDKVCWSGAKPRIYSWHFHVLFQGGDQQMVKDAKALQGLIASTFNVKDECDTLYHQDHMCMFDFDTKPSGPFPTAAFAVFFTPQNFSTVVPWILQHRERRGRISTACTNWNITDPSCGVDVPSFDVLIHPNSGCEYEDHGKWNMWAGTPWNLNMAAMDTAEPFDNGLPDPYDGDGPMPQPLPVPPKH
jgi:aromatic ring-cleaving dioxygenase